MKLDDSATVEIAASAEACFTVLTDYERYPEWFGCERAELVARAPDKVAMSYDLVGTDFDVVVAFRGQPPTELDAEVVEGHRRLKSMSAGWRLESSGDGLTLARYSLAVELDVPLVIRGIARSRGRELMLDEPVRGLKTQVEGQRA